MGGLSALGPAAYAADDGHITGTVTGTVHGADDIALEGIQVVAFQFDGDNWVDVSYADTDSLGSYDLGGLSTGTYRVRYYDFDDSADGYVQEFYNDAATVETGDDVDVTAGETTDGINAQLTTLNQITGHITGTVTGTVQGADDIALEGIQVVAFQFDGDNWVDVSSPTPTALAATTSADCPLAPTGCGTTTSTTPETATSRSSTTTPPPSRPATTSTSPLVRPPTASTRSSPR